MGHRSFFGLIGTLGLALLLLLTGCGGGGSAPVGSSEAQAPGHSSAPAAQAPKEPQSAEASIEGFGKEAGGSEREAILQSFDGYLEALAHKDYASACEHMDAQLHESLAQLAGKKGVDCPKLLPLLVSPEAAAVARGQLEGKVRKVRVEGERGFVVFHAPGAKLYDMAMVAEGGEWKVGAAAAGVLVPEL